MIDKAHAAVVSLVVRPADSGFFGTVIGDRVILDRFGFTRFAAFHFVPRIVGKSVAILVLHDVYDTGFGTSIERVAEHTEIIIAVAADNAVAAIYGQVAAETAEADVVAFVQAFLGVCIGFFVGSRFITRIDELARSSHEFHDGKAFRAGIRAEAVHFIVRTDAIYLDRCGCGIAFALGKIPGKHGPDLWRMIGNGQFYRIDDNGLEENGTPFHYCAGSRFDVGNRIGRLDSKRRALFDADNRFVLGCSVFVGSHKLYLVIARFGLGENLIFVRPRLFIVDIPLVGRPLAVLYIGRKGQFRIHISDDTAFGHSQRYDGRRHLKDVDAHLFFGITVLGVNPQRNVILARFVRAENTDRLRTDDFPVLFPRIYAAVAVFHGGFKHDIAVDLSGVDAGRTTQCDFRRECIVHIVFATGCEQNTAEQQA